MIKTDLHSAFADLQTANADLQLAFVDQQMPIADQQIAFRAFPEEMLATIGLPNCLLWAYPRRITKHYKNGQEGCAELFTMADLRPFTLLADWMTSVGTT